MSKQQPDPLIRRNLGLHESTWAEVAEFRFAERVATESEAVRRLIAMALDTWGGAPRKRTPRGKA